VKGSVFLAFATRAENADAALTHVRQVAERHPDASHVCWAYRVGHAYRFSDAGEPSGTAGQPIYRAIEGQSLDHVAVAVVRYFGGTKLGACGLARAYGGVAAEALRRAPKRTERPQRGVEISVSFACLGRLYFILDGLGIGERREVFDETGIRVRAQVGEDQLARLEEELRDATRDEFSLVADDSF
jgi:putative IMPACT (imprinted ancient) family translation regulator